MNLRGVEGENIPQLTEGGVQAAVETVVVGDEDPQLVRLMW